MDSIFNFLNIKGSIFNFLNIKGYLQNSVILRRDLWFNIIIAQSADWHTFCGFSVCTTQSADCANIYIYMQGFHTAGGDTPPFSQLEFPSLEFRLYLLQHVTTFQLKVFWDPRSHQKQLQRA